MNAKEFFDMKVEKAKGFCFPEPIYINAEKLTSRTRVVYLVEVQSMMIPDKVKGKMHHGTLKFSKFKKSSEEPYWIEQDITSKGFTISEKTSLERLVSYINVNQSLLNIDVSSQDRDSFLLTNNKNTVELMRKILKEGNRDQVLDLLKEEFPRLEEKILTHKLVESRKAALYKYKQYLSDPTKNERNFWQLFLKDNKWIFGISYVVLLDDSRIDLRNTADYLLESDDGFVDIVEIKHPQINFWQKKAGGSYDKYRGFLQPSKELRGSITQAINYIFQVEKKFSDPDWCRTNKCEIPVKPRCLVVIGRSDKWSTEEKTAFRLLNDSLHGIEVITFDHLLNRAERLLCGLQQQAS
jgi:hypothetical protein